LAGREPSWWYGAGHHWQTTLLSPFEKIFGTIAAARLAKASSYKSRLPVICVGNFTAGGSGKTPLALLVARLVSELGHEPWFLSRGYGGRLTGPVQVAPGLHGSHDVGDEPLLLARQAATVIARDRRLGAKAIEATVSDNAVIIMDDGLQNPALAKDLVLAVVSGDRGFGNGRVIPAGPLRAPLSAQIGLANVIVVAGQTLPPKRDLLQSLHSLTQAPIVFAATRPVARSEEFLGRRVLAYAGIAHPERFFSMLEGLGAVLVERRVFVDHHAFHEVEARDLLDAARRTSADLVTTEKDIARLSGEKGACADLRNRSTSLAIETVIEGGDLAIVKEKIREALER
jgi:tetraacyldisaccharide 4'-kinase